MGETLSLQSKYGVDISAEIADAKTRENAVLIINLAADDEMFPINGWLTNTHDEDLIAGAKKITDEIGATETILVVPETINLTALDGENEVPAKIELSVPDAKVVRVPRSRVLREESALFHIIDTGELRSCPLEKEFPSEGYQGRPTVAIDGETLYRYATGKDTKVIFLPSKSGGKIVEVPIGKKISEVIAEAGYETKKPILLGGVTGRFVPENADAAVEYTDLFDSIRVFGDQDCMADVTAKLMNAAHEESCTKCVICREGTWHLSGIFNDITAGKGKKDDLDMVADIGPLIHLGSFCSFGQNMANVATSSAELNREELLAHIVKKQCPAGVCAAFNRTTYCIDPEKCVGCGDCEDECPEMAIEGKAKFIYMIDQDMCTGCGDCVSSCDEDAIIVNDGTIKLPKKLTKVGKF